MTPDRSIAEHITWLKRRNLSPNTAIHRRGQLLRLQEFLGTPLLDATADDLERWQTSLRVCPSSVLTYTSHVRAFYEWATETGRITTDPSSNLVLPKIKQRLPRPIPEDQLKTALDGAFHMPKMYAWLLLAGYCGLRAGEIALVTRADFRIDDTGKGAFLLVHGKGGKERVVRVSAEVMAEVSPFFVRTGPIFRRANGTGYSPNYVTALTSEFLKGLGLPYTLHTLRHRFATRLCDLGADIRDVQVAMGHTNLATTSLYLAHNSRRSAATVDKLSSGLSTLRTRQQHH